MTTKNPEILEDTPLESRKNVLELSRTALAEKLHMSESELPDGTFFRIVDAELDKLAWLDPAKKATELRHRLESIKSAELADKAKELSEKWKEVLTSEALEKTSSAVSGAAEKLRNEWLTHGKEAVTAVWAIVWAQSMGEATKWVDGLTKVIESSGKMISSAIDTIKDIFASLFQMLGLDKLFKSIGKLFGMDFPDEEKKQGEETKKGIEDKVNPTIENTKNIMKNPEKIKEIFYKMGEKFGDKISDTYFPWQKLSKSQIDKIAKIFQDNANPEVYQKIAERIEKEGLAINFGELTGLIWEVGWSYPAKVMWDLSLSGIIPVWAISQQIVVSPGKNLIALTFDGIPGFRSVMPLEDVNWMLKSKLEWNDSHVRDMARIQLYSVNRALWAVLGTALAGITTAGIATFADVSSKAWVTKLWWKSLVKDYAPLADEIEKIEKILKVGSAESDMYKQLIGMLQKTEATYKLMGIVRSHTIDGVMDTTRIIEDAKSLWIETGTLKKSIQNQDLFRDELKKFASPGGSTNGPKQAITREAQKYFWGQSWEIARYIDRVSATQKWQAELIGDTSKYGLDIMKRFALAYNSLKLARAWDTVHLHLETVDDVSKLRSFLSVIPGGIKALSEILPAAAMTISVSSVVWDAKEKKGAWITESLLDICTTYLIPVYGTFGILKEKTINISKMINGEEPLDFVELAFGGVVGWVFVYELWRVWSGLVDIFWNGNVVKGLWKLTYVTDIGRGMGQIVRGTKNMYALASKPIASPEFTKTLSKVAQKFPKKWRLAIGAALLTIAGWAYAYISGPESPEDIEKSLQKDGWIDTDKHITDKLKTAFYQKTPTERKQLLDELFLMYRWTVDNLPSTYYDETSQSYTIVGNKEIWGLIDSPFRKTIQALGVDIHF